MREAGAIGISRAEQVAVVGFGVALLAAVLVFLTNQRAPEPVVVTTPPAPARIKVHVAGEVVWPGQYLLAAGSRVQDAVFAAHGPTLTADLNRVNLAAVLRDGDRVVVPRIVQPTYPFQMVKKPLPGGLSPPPSSSSSPAPPRAAASPSKMEGGEQGQTVNVNTATAEDLERLPGIGPVLARRIVAHREQKGLFRRLDDLVEVQGLGPKLLRRLEPMLRLE